MQYIIDLRSTKRIYMPFFVINKLRNKHVLNADVAIPDSLTGIW